MIKKLSFRLNEISAMNLLHANDWTLENAFKIRKWSHDSWAPFSGFTVTSFWRWLVDVAWQVNSSFIKSTVYFNGYHYSAVIIVTFKCALETLKRATESRLTIEFIIKVKTSPSQKWLKFMLSILIPFSQTKKSCKIFVVSCTVYKYTLCVHFLNCVRSRHA